MSHTIIVLLQSEGMPNSERGHNNQQTEPLPSLFCCLCHQALSSIGTLTEVSMKSVESQGWIKYRNFITTASLHGVVLKTAYELVITIHLCSNEVSCFFLEKFALSTITAYHLQETIAVLKIHYFCCLISSNWNCTFVFTLFQLL